MRRVARLRAEAAQKKRDEISRTRMKKWGEIPGTREWNDRLDRVENAQAGGCVVAVIIVVAAIAWKYFFG